MRCQRHGYTFLTPEQESGSCLSHVAFSFWIRQTKQWEDSEGGGRLSIFSSICHRSLYNLPRWETVCRIYFRCSNLHFTTPDIDNVDFHLRSTAGQQWTLKLYIVPSNNVGLLSPALHHSEGFGSAPFRTDETLLQQPSISWNQGRRSSPFMLLVFCLHLLSCPPPLFVFTSFLSPSISLSLLWQCSQHHDWVDCYDSWEEVGVQFSSKRKCPRRPNTTLCVCVCLMWPSDRFLLIWSGNLLFTARNLSVCWKSW